ncbi:tRNA (cytidine(34)-2'-O)-methyltransferase [Linum grandiflorum]
MEATACLKALNPRFPLHFLSSKSQILLRPINFIRQLNPPPPSRRRSSFRAFCSLRRNQCGGLIAAESGNGYSSSSSSLPRGAGEAVCDDASRRKLLQVVLVSPQIPGNTGCIARTCAASGVGLHLVRIRYVVVKIHDSWAEFREYFNQQEGEKRLLALTKRGTKTHSECSYRKGDYLVFGAETFGLPPEALEDCKDETFGGGTIRIPMVETYVRCLNLSVSVGIALYEAARQLNYEQLQQQQHHQLVGDESITREDIFA